jgi:hypothetical protein
VLSQFADISNLCMAVSQTSDPTGAYYLYTWNIGSLPDYYKIGVWPDGYYVSANQAIGYTAYALDRVAMLSGAPATNVGFYGFANFVMPSDLDGGTPPPAGSPNLFYTFLDSGFHGGASDRIELYGFHADYVTPGNSTITLLNTFNTSFQYTVCGFFNLDCAGELGISQKLDVISEWPMFRFPYRNYGSYQALAGTFTVGGGSGEVGAAPYWFELRDTGSGWTLYQNGTFDPADGHDRFMGSIAMDYVGNIALGYSVSSTTMYPSIRYTVHEISNPLGVMQSEVTMIEGTGSQFSSNRWGDYSAMSIDPADGCTFWYTNEYYVANGSDWHTRIGSFTLPSCSPPAVSLNPASIDYGNIPVGNSSAPVTVTLTNNGGAFLHVGTLSTGLADFVLSNNTCDGQAIVSGGTCTFDVTFTPTSGGLKNDSVTVPSDAVSSPDYVTLAGNGGLPAVSLNPVSIDFGNQEVGTTSAAQLVTLTNSGGGDLVIGTLTFTSDYFLSSDTCSGATVAFGGGTCTFYVAFHPLAVGTLNGTIGIPSNAATSVDHVLLTGYGYVPTSATFFSNKPQDGHATEKSEFANIGGSSSASGGYLQIGDLSADRQIKGFLSFDTSGLPDNAVVVGAHIEMRYIGKAGDNPFLWAGPLLVDIASPFGTSELMKPEDFQATAAAFDVANCGSVAVLNWYTCDLDSGFNAFNLVGATQFRLYFTLDDNDDKRADYVKLASGNHNKVAYHPVLIVDYFIP